MPDVGRVLRAVDEPNVQVDSFLNLVPITTDNRELGIEYRTDNLQAEISYYQSDSDYGSRLAMNDDGIFDLKREKTEIAGLEANAEWFFDGDSSVGFAYSKPTGEYDADGDDSVDTDLDGANITPPRVNLFWSQQWTNNLNTRLQASRLMDRNYKDATGDTYFGFDGYTLVDVATTWELTQSVVRLSLQNLTNEDYVALYSQNRRSDSLWFKGRGRTLSLSYTYQF